VAVDFGGTAGAGILTVKEAELLATVLAWLMSDSLSDDALIGDRFALPHGVDAVFACRG
jgi:hypothetical protein